MEKLKYQKEIMITAVMVAVIFALRLLNVFQVENGLAHPLVMLLMIVGSSLLAIWLQRDMDANYAHQRLYYPNLNILKYVCAVLIVILHLRPFLGYSSKLDLAFNNILSRICVPVFFLITGYFVAQKEKTNPTYIRSYIQKNIHLYLVWSMIYIPVSVYFAFTNRHVIDLYIPSLSFPLYALIPLVILGLPLILIFYTGTYYHLWYFPAVILSLIVVAQWKKRWSLGWLLVISFVLLLFGATETYYGVLPLTLQRIISYYYNIFFTTRNFLFFGLFYVVLGYYLGSKKQVYASYCLEKLLISIMLLVFEALLLQGTERLNSNILLACVPVTYYLFVCTIYLSNHHQKHLPFGELSKYYYLIHPIVIVLVTAFPLHPLLQLLVVLLLTQLVSYGLYRLKRKHPSLPI